MSLRTIYKIKKRGTYDTDKYEMHFRITEDMTGKSVWEADVYVGPGAYNSGHIDNVLSNYNNDVDSILDYNNPVFTSRATLSKQKVRFEP